MLNTNPLNPVHIDTGKQRWLPSPAQGIWRKPLAREAAESGHATSLVKYEPGARFQAHNHPGGEEILVLEGCFSDESGDYPQGSYLRNPIGFRHAPFSQEGCLLFVKLHQFQSSDTLRLSLDSNRYMLYTRRSEKRQNLCMHEHKKEAVTIEHYRATSRHKSYYQYGVELFVLNGELAHNNTTLSQGHWLRLPADSSVDWVIKKDTKLWIKEGHLGLDEYTAPLIGLASYKHKKQEHYNEQVHSY